MRGAVAAGHEITAQAGARVLAEGGNAVDACIAAAFASWVAESTLTGPGAGGFMLIHRGHDRSSRLLDFFVATPGQGERQLQRAEMDAVDIPFESGTDTTQRFLIGHASCAVPGTVAGLAEAHRAYGKLQWPELLAPAIELARDGVKLTEGQALLHMLLDSILRHTPESRAVYGERARLVEGDRIVARDLARTLEELSAEGPDAFYRGDIARAIAEHVQDHGGTITRRDLETYRVVRRRPVEVAYCGHSFESNPPPSSGGVLIGYGLAILDRLTPLESGSAPGLARVIEVLREQARVRDNRFSRELYRGGLARRLLAASSVSTGAERVRRSPAAPVEVGSPTGTTHISVMDADGNAAALSSSTGAGSGVVVPGTGIHMNNMLGEYDLQPGGPEPAPGTRLTSMMAPSIVSVSGEPRLVLGSAGSARLRGAVMQVIVNVIGHRMGVDEAIVSPRVHVDEPHVHAEGGHDPAALDELERAGYDIVRWRDRNLFFGGVAAVERRPDGTLAAAGDPRRGGHGMVV
jgi:gamma-glutamyltranspeptidase/glutathione hydrolase